MSGGSLGKPNTAQPIKKTPYEIKIETLRDSSTKRLLRLEDTILKKYALVKKAQKYTNKVQD